MPRPKPCALPAVPNIPEPTEVEQAAQTDASPERAAPVASPRRRQTHSVIVPDNGDASNLSENSEAAE
jgi:hypothetical protein